MTTSSRNILRLPDFLDETPPKTLPALIAQHGIVQPEAPAIFSSAASACSYAELNARISCMGQLLRRAGVGPQGRVAILVDKPIDLAHAIVAVMCNAVAIPLDPALTSAEMADVHARLRLDAVLTDGREPTLPGWHTRHDGSLFAYGEPRQDSWVESTPDEGNWAYAIRSSGTSSVPKLVPVTHSNLMDRMWRMQRWLSLTPADRSLCVAKLHYVFGLETLLLTPLALGGSVAFPADGGADGDVLSWISDLQPTYYCAGPVFHLNVLEQLRRRGARPRHRLRLIQSGGAPLPETAKTSLREALGVPVLEAYGLTEAGQLASECIETGARRAGTVGRPDAGTLRIVDAGGNPLPPGTLGEVVTCGAHVSPGAVDADGVLQPLAGGQWFATGDVGRFDSDGFLSIVGRAKDIVNRGGEKISPAEVDAIMLEHPDVLEAASYAIPHPRLGEDIAASVVLRASAQAQPLDLRRFLGARLAPFKVPRTIRFVERLPRNAAGKVLRHQLSGDHVAQASRDSTPGSGQLRPRSSLELEIVAIFNRLLQRSDVSPLDDFFAAGGDSLLAAQLRRELELLVGHRTPDDLLFAATSPRELADAIVESGPMEESLLMPLRRDGRRQPLIVFDGDLNGGGYYMRRIAQGLGNDRPVWLLRPFDATRCALPSIPQMASHYLELLRAAGLKPPYLFAGYCNGALVALETARQAEAAGDEVAIVALIDPISINARRPVRWIARVLRAALRVSCRDQATRERRFARSMAGIWKFVESPRRVLFRLLAGRAVVPAVPPADDRLEPNWAYDKRMAEFFLPMAAFLPGPVAAPLVCITPMGSARQHMFASRPWRRFGRTFDAYVTPGTHLTCTTSEAAELAGILCRSLSRH